MPGSRIQKQYKEGCDCVKEDWKDELFEEKKEILERELSESGLRKVYSEVIWDIIPLLNELNRQTFCGVRAADHGEHQLEDQDAGEHRQ